MPIQIQYRFDYLHQIDVVRFNLNVNGQGFTIAMTYDNFILLMGEVVKTAQPFFEQIAQQRASGIKQDLKVEFDETKWNKMMEGKDG